MSKQARVTITADTRSFKKQMDEAKKSVEGVGKAQVDSRPTENLYKKVLDLRKELDSTNDAIKRLGKGGIKQSDLAQWQKLVAHAKELKKEIKETVNYREKLANTPDPKDKIPKEPTEPKSSGPFGMSKFGSTMSLLAGGYGIMSLYNRRVQMASGRMSQRALTTDSGYASESSNLGFTTEERRQRASELAREASPMSSKQLSALTDVADKMERAYGITDSANAVGVARRAGVQDQGKFLTDVTSRARGAGYEGPMIGEYLSSMTGFLSEMSKGIDINSDSLNGMAGAIGTLPFFKNDPSRVFDAMRGMNNAFTNGDEFQKAQAIRAIGASAPGSSASMLEMRREMGIFGSVDSKTMAGLQKAGVDTRSLGVSGGQIIKNTFSDIMNSTSGMSPDQQLYEFTKRLGVKPGEGMSMFAAAKNGASLDTLDKMAKDAAKSPEDKLKDTMSNMDGSIKNLDAQISRIVDGMANNVAEPMTRLAAKIDELIKAMGGDTEGIMSGLGTAGVVGAAGAGAVGALGLSKVAGKATGKLTGKLAEKGVGKGMGKAIGKGASKIGGHLAKGASKMIPFAGNIASAGFMMKDIYDIKDKWDKGESTDAGDWISLAGDAIGVVPGIGNVASGLGMAASIGGEFMHDDTPSKPVPKSGAVAGPSASMSGDNGDPYLVDNTMAIKELTQQLRTKGSVGSSRMPSNASFNNGRTGK